MGDDNSTSTLFGSYGSECHYGKETRIVVANRDSFGDSNQ